MIDRAARDQKQAAQLIHDQMVRSNQLLTQRNLSGVRELSETLGPQVA